MADILDVIVSRRSVKKFKPDRVEDELIEKVLKAGTFAPSGKNMQSPIIVAVTNNEVRDKLSEICKSLRGIDFDPYYGAPVALVVLADKNWFTYIYDGSVVMENMLLEAHSLGLGACWIHHTKETMATEYGKELLKKLGILGEYEGIGTCVLGYPDVCLTEPLPRKDNYVFYVK